MLHDPNLIVTDGSGSQTEQDTKSHYQGYGYLVLFLGRLQRQTRLSKYVWGKDKTNVVREYKTNTIKVTHHTMDQVVTITLLEIEPTTV